MPDEAKLVFVKGTAGEEAVRERRRRAIRALDEAEREFAETEREMFATFGPDPRGMIVEQEIAAFCAQITGRRSSIPAS
jgi:hypothetical protein